MSTIPGLWTGPWTGPWTDDHLSAFSVIFSCLAIMLSAISVSGMKRICGSTQTGEYYSNTTFNSPY